jgi:pyruvate formate-lyase/glycerol dehydratase family glycyl radical enzyme
MKTKTISPDTVTNLRVKRLRERIINAPQEVCIERARYLTESMSENWNAHPLTRMSIAFENILKKISIIIRDDELIVGCRTSKLKGAPLFPENKSRWIEGDVDNFDHRVVQRALISEDEKRELMEEILPFWKGKTVEEYFEELLPGDVYDDMDKYIFTIMLEITYGIGHFTMDNEKILSRGLSGIITDARERYNSLSDDEKKGEKGLFYDAAIRSMEAAISFAHRYAERAAEMATAENNPGRAEELNEIARVCRRVPEYPPENFHEAVQSVYFIHLISQIESGGNSISLGRIDQYLYPFYQREREAGNITAEQARELIALLFLKTNELWNVLEEAFIAGGEGTEGKTTQNVVVGGVSPDGEDATNELSFIVLDAYAEIRTVQPNFGVRLSGKAPDEFFEKAVDYARNGVLMHFFNDDTIVQALTDAGHTIQDARNYGVVGCLEPNAQGKTFGSTFAVQLNGMKFLEFALNNGEDSIFGFQSGIETGDPASFTSFDDVWNAYDRQLTHFIGQMKKGMECLDRAIAEMVPSPFASAMIEGPLEKGKDLTSGGAVYNSTGVQFMGFSNVADSFYAIKKTVFEEEKFTLGELAQWLSDDWIDAEDKRIYLLNKIPKYGNDKDDVDAIAIQVMNHFCDELARHTNYRGGAFWPGMFSVGFHIAMGAFTGASADGRFAGDILGNGITPSEGRAISGPTSLMNSVTKLPVKRLFNGANLNMRFSGNRIKTSDLVSLMKVYFQKMGYQVQFNMIDTDLLRSAQEKPDQYRDLIVRISGYSVIFIGLSETAQEEIISRTEYGL